MVNSGFQRQPETFVAKVAVDFVDAIEAADSQPLEIKLRSDAQVQIHVERVVMGDERLGDRAARDLLHHGRFDFDEVLRIEEPPHRLHQFAALQKYFAHFRIHDQIDIALPVSQLNIRQAMPFLRQRQQIFR